MSAMSIITLAGGRETFGWRCVIVQTAAVVLGLTAVVIISMLDYDAFISKLVVPIFIVSCLAIVAVLIFGSEDKGQKNWINFGFLSVQPSEFVKILYIITFSKHIDRVKANINHPKNVLALMVHAGIIIGLLLLTKDLGTALVYIAITAAMLFAAGLSIWYFIGAAVAAIIIFPFIWEHLGAYQQERILVGFNPSLDPLNKGYQPLLSKKAIAAGGLKGAGFSGGTVYKSLPVAESDFLFAVLCEKFGFAGAFLYIILSGVLIMRLLVMARGARKDYGALICVGVAAILIAQTVENIGMCLAMLPVVGITLPFFSYGGSSMLSLYLSIAVVQSIHTHNEKYYFERESA